MPLIYADVDALTDWTGQPEPDNAVTLLREASILVGSACQADIYDTLPSGLPSNDAVADAMRDATCAQVEAWGQAGVDPIAGPGGQEPRLTVSGIDGANYSYDTYLTAEARSAMLTSLVPSAYRILRLVGLASGWVR